MAQDAQDQAGTKEWRQVVERAWSDEAYKQRLFADPRAVLAEAGIPVPPTLTMEVHEATPTHVHLVLPPPPHARTTQELTEAELEQVAGGNWQVSIESLFDWIGCAIGVYC